MFVWDGDNLTLTVEIWRIREFFFKIINRIYLLLGKGWYFIDCGYCDRRNGEMICRCPTRISDDPKCTEECRKRTKEAGSIFNAIIFGKMVNELQEMIKPENKRKLPRIVARFIASCIRDIWGGGIRCLDQTD